MLNSYFKKKISSLKWVLFVSRRFSRVDRKGRSAVTTFLASLGICFGVMTLITVISVMNGFQRSFIDSILEISSYHIRIDDVKSEKSAALDDFLTEETNVRSFSPFYEAQSLMVGVKNKECAAIIRAVPPLIHLRDAGFRKELYIWRGNFDLSRENSIILGSSLAHDLGVHVGNQINLFALSGGTDVELFSSDRTFTVTGIFHCGYSDLNSNYAFISLSDGEKYFGKNAALNYGVKIFDTNQFRREIQRIKSAFPEFQVQSWREYNRSFFGALRVEKNMLMILVFLIFVVVAINIFNGMRRMVYERREEISVISAFGGNPSYIQWIFIVQGFLIGISGAFPGMILGLLISVQMNFVFNLMSKIIYYVNLFFVMIINPAAENFVRENSMFLLYAKIPPRIYLSEVILITLFGIFSALFASWSASRGILKMTVAEVMRDE